MADGRVNTNPVLINDLDAGYENQRRKVKNYVPVGGFIDIPGTSRSLISFEQGTIRKFHEVGVIIAQMFVTPERFTTAGLPPANQYPSGAYVWDETASTPLFSDGFNWIPASGPAGINTDMFLWGNSSVSPTTTTRYLSPFFDGSLAETSPIQFRVLRSGFLDKLRVRHNSPSGNGNLIVYTVRVASVATALAVSMASTATDGSNFVTSLAVTAGDLVDIRVTKALNVGASPGNVIAEVDWHV
jgi:hypothetical protein